MVALGETLLKVGYQDENRQARRSVVKIGGKVKFSIGSGDEVDAVGSCCASAKPGMVKMLLPWGVGDGEAESESRGKVGRAVAKTPRVWQRFHQVPCQRFWFFFSIDLCYVT